DKITKIDDVDTSELVETPKESMSLEEKEKREKIKRECEILKMTMSY
ncbi:TPA: Clp protease ClpP, partial [Staphylococcus aureus]|nr:Clp protease ClpP [Staphylococcus aureus]